MTFLIIDATAGYRLMWKGKDAKYTVFLDKRPECRPDILCDDRQLPLRDHIADVIIFDPPHLTHITRTRAKQAIYRATHYAEHNGCWWIDRMIYDYSYYPNQTAWINHLYHTNTEFHRIIKPTGTLHAKLTDFQQERGRNPIQNIKNLYTRWKYGYDLTMRSRTGQGNKPVRWLTFIPHY